MTGILAQAFVCAGSFVDCWTNSVRYPEFNSISDVQGQQIPFSLTSQRWYSALLLYFVDEPACIATMRMTKKLSMTA